MMEKTEHTIKTLFDDISSRYDLFNSASTFFLDRHWRRSASHLVKKKNAKVLDVCTGTAELALRCAGRFNGGGRVIGIDFSEKMIGLAQKKLRRLGKEKEVFLLVGNAQSLSFQDNLFDYVTSAFSMRNLTDVDQALREMRRVLKPGGKAVILEINHPTHRLTGLFYKGYLKGVVPLIGLLTVGKLYPFLYLKNSVLAFQTPKEFCEKLRAAGFQDVLFKTFTPGAIGLYQATK